MDTKNYKLIAEYCYYFGLQKKIAEFYNSDIARNEEEEMLVIHQDFEEAFYFAVNHSEQELTERISVLNVQ